MPMSIVTEAFSVPYIVHVSDFMMEESEIGMDEWPVSTYLHTTKCFVF